MKKNKLNENEESGLKSVNTAMGEKVVRIVISGESVAKTKDAIIKLIKRQDSDATINYFEATGKIVGNVKEFRLDSIKRDLKSYDPTIVVEKKPLVKSLKEGEKRLVKITKEQYNRIFASGLIKESVESPLYVEYYKDMSGEEPFELGGNKYQYVWAKYPTGKKDIGVYAFGQDLVYSYDTFRKMHRLQNEETSIVKGGLSRVDKTFKKAFAGKEISDMKVTRENEMTGKPFKIAKPLKGVSVSKQGKFGKSITEGEDNLKEETLELIKYLYRESKDFSPFWEEHDLTYDDICDALLAKKLIIKKDGKFEVSKSLGNSEAAKQSIEDELRTMIGGEEESIDEGDWFDNHPDHPANQPDPQYRQGTNVKNPKLGIVADNGELAIFKSEDGTLYVFYYDHIDREEFKEYADIEIIGYDDDGEGGYDAEYSDDWDIDEDVLFNYVNDNLSSLKIGDGLDAYESGDFDLVKIDDELREDLLRMYDKDQRITKILSSLNESESEEERMSRLKAVIAQRRADSQKYEDEYFKKRDAQNVLNTKKANQAEKGMGLKSVPAPEPKKPVGQYNVFGGVDEMTSTGSVGGAFTPALSMDNSSVVKKTMPNVPVVKENTVAGPASTGPYDANALPGIKRDGSFKETAKPNAFKKTQWSGGGFVDFNDCVDLNNKPAGTGCSAGAVDNVVKIRKTKGNVNAPSLNEGMMREALKLQHDKKENRLIVLSDLEGRAASQETFSNKNVLKQAGFVWTGTNWAIPVDKLDVAKQTLSLINKAEYLIDTLEDLEDAIDDSGADNKSLLKARLDQYISDLANATDEAALSAEIRRYLTFFSKFHSYSFYNRMLIFIQKPDATKVASYKTWQSKFRQVNKGAKAITVLAPVSSKVGSPAASDDETENDMINALGAGRQTVTRFKAVSVFDISDTTAMDERGEVPEQPQWWGENTPSETADMLFGAVVEVAKDLGINVTQTDAKGGEKGFSAGDHINISSDVSGAGRLSTMIHEIAHELMHWKKSSIYFIDNGDGRQKSELQELQAESVSYVVLKHYGIPVAHHATYLALWKANKDRIQNNLEIISKVSQFIITKIDAQVSEGK
jgi:hypothetical protein